MLTIVELTAQCNNIFQYPSSVVQAPYFEGVKTIATDQFAGDYAEISGFRENFNYQITSTGPDYISIYTVGDVLIAQGAAPLSFNVGFIDITTSLKVNFNLITPPCGEENVQRTTEVICTDCPKAANVGIGNSSPNSAAILDLTNSNQQSLRLPQSIGIPENPNTTTGLLIYDDLADDILLHTEDRWQRLATTEDVDSYTNRTTTIVIPGSKFLPLSSSTDFSWVSGRGRYSDGGILLAPFTVPVGNTITKIIYYYYDFSSSLNLQIRLMFGDALSPGIFANYAHESTGSSSNLRSASFENLNLEVDDRELFYFSFNPEGSTLSSLLAIKAVSVSYTRTID